MKISFYNIYEILNKDNFLFENDNVSIGDNCHISNTIIENSIIMSNTQIEENKKISNSIIAYNSQILSKENTNVQYFLGENSKISK